MTLIVNVLTRDAIVHASDMRFTYAGGVPPRETEPKVVAVQGPHFNALVAFTGLAHVGNHWTNDWLTETIESGKLMDLEPPAFHRELADRATQRWRPFFGSCNDRDLRTSFVTAGWTHANGRATAFHGWISNFESPDLPIERRARRRFDGRWALFERESLRPEACVTFMFGSGSRSSNAKTYARGVRRMVERRETPEAISRLLGAAMAREAENAELKGTVGQLALGVVVPYPGDTVFAGAFTHDGTRVKVILPDAVQSGATFRNMRVWYGPVPKDGDGLPLDPNGPGWEFLKETPRR